MPDRAKNLAAGVRGGILDGAEAPGIDRPTWLAVNETLIGDYRSVALAIEIIEFYSLWQRGDMAPSTHSLRLQINLKPLPRCLSIEASSCR
jgi:hypothetical protein